MNKDDKTREPSRLGSAMFGASVMQFGYNVAQSGNRMGWLDGRVKLYHNTSEENVTSILENGLLANKANGTTYTRNTLNVSDSNTDFDGKTYLATRPELAKGVGMQRSLAFDRNNPITGNKNIKVSMPIDDYKALDKVRNPELFGAKNIFQHVRNGYRKDGIAGAYVNTFAYDSLARQTKTIAGDISTKHIVGSNNYVPNKTSDIIKHVKSRPGHVAGAIGLIGIGGTIGVGGFNIFKKAFRKSDQSVKSNRSVQEQSSE